MNMYEKYKYIEGTDADGWNYRILKSSEDLKKEAEEAEKAGERNSSWYFRRYDKKIASGKSLIVIATKPDGTRIDMEIKINRDGRLYIEDAYYNCRFWLTLGDNYHLYLWIDGISYSRDRQAL